MNNIANFILVMQEEGFNLQLVVSHGGEYFTAELVDADASLTNAPLFDAQGERQLEGRGEFMQDAIAELEEICEL